MNANKKVDVGNEVQSTSGSSSASFTQSNIEDISVSMVRNCKCNDPIEFSLLKICNAIVSGRYDAAVQDLRALKAKADYGAVDHVKLNQLPAFTPSGVFNGGRKKDNIFKYTSVVVLDIDNLQFDEIERVFPIITEIPFTLSAFRSPSGNGIKILVVTDNTEVRDHEKAYQQVSDYYKSILGLEIDESGKDVTRLCIISSDPKGYINQIAKQFEVKKKINDDVTFYQGYNTALKWTNRKCTFEEGNRNNFIYNLACRCNRIGLDKEKVAQRIIVDFKLEGNIGEMIRSINSAYSNGYEFGDFATHVDKSVAVVAQQHTKIGSSLKSFRQLAEEGKSLSPLRKIFGNYILEKSTNLFPSERGVGKSLLAVQIAVKVASGEKEFLGEEIGINGNVLYINLELGDHSISKRMEELMKDQNSESPHEAYCLTSREGLFAIMDEVKAFCYEKKPVLIIIDNLRTAFNGSDNEKNKEMTKVITEVNILKDEVGASIVLVHHVKKGSGNQLTNSDMQSGAGSLTDLVDADFFLRRSGMSKDLRILKRVKSRECEEQDGAKLISLNPESLWFEFIEEGIDEGLHVLADKADVHKEALKQKALELFKTPMSDANIALQLGIDRVTVWRWRKKHQFVVA